MKQLRFDPIVSPPIFSILREIIRGNDTHEKLKGCIGKARTTISEQMNMLVRLGILASHGQGRTRKTFYLKPAGLRKEFLKWVKSTELAYEPTKDFLEDFAGQKVFDSMITSTIKDGTDFETIGECFKFWVHFLLVFNIDKLPNSKLKDLIIRIRKESKASLQDMDERIVDIFLEQQTK